MRRLAYFPANVSSCVTQGLRDISLSLCFNLDCKSLSGSSSTSLIAGRYHLKALEEAICFHKIVYFLGNVLLTFGTT